MRALSANEVGIPRHPWQPGDDDAFSLSSHARAREALDLALSIEAPGFNVFVLGEDRTGRMSATVRYLRSICGARRQRQQDWLYLQNFRADREPLAFGLRPGDGKHFVEALNRFVGHVRTMLVTALESESHRERVSDIYRKVQVQLTERREQISRMATEVGFELEHTSEGIRIVPAANKLPGNHDDRERLSQELDQLERQAGKLRTAADAQALDLDRQTLKSLIDVEVGEFVAATSRYPALLHWIDELVADMIENVHNFSRPRETDDDLIPVRYMANLFVDHSDGDDCVVLEPNPNYENIFGRIEYRRIEGMSETDLLLVRPGALHRANGGVLVIRAEALVKDETTWTYLKAALRDNVIRIEEPHRSGGIPLVGTPKPAPIPLDAKIIIVGSPDSYYRFFSSDPDFKTYFKIKADIDPDMPASKSNLDSFGQIISQMAAKQGVECEPQAISLLLGIASRWAARRDALTARFEVVEDLIYETCRATNEQSVLTEAGIKAAWIARRHRDGRAEERFRMSMQRRHVAITTAGSVVGQVNALTVRDLGDQQFGRPSRVTARASIGHRGVINLERMTDLGGRTQQKGAMVVEGYLRGVFGRRHPVSFDCSITFEQNYGSIDGDSASVAELVAILSALANVPIRQELAVTGSFNQLGEVQSVGDTIEKVEGFFRATEQDRAKGLSHGVVLPISNANDLVLEDEVAEAIEAGRFTIWGIERVEEAVELLTGVPATEHKDKKVIPVYDRVAQTLREFDELIRERYWPQVDAESGRTSPQREPSAADGIEDPEQNL